MGCPQVSQPSILITNKCTAQASRPSTLPTHTRQLYLFQKQSRPGQALTETFQKCEILTLLQPKG